MKQVIYYPKSGFKSYLPIIKINRMFISFLQVELKKIERYDTRADKSLELVYENLFQQVDKPHII